MKPYFFLTIVLATILFLNGCTKKDSKSTPANVPETWSGTLTGAAENPIPSSGKFDEAYTFSITVPGSLFSALQIPYNSSAKITSGSGTFSGSETVAVPGPSGIYTLHASSVSNVPLTVTYASILVLSSTPTPTIKFESSAGQTLIRNYVTADYTGADHSHPATIIWLYGVSVTATQITGTWDNGGLEENTAKGTFTLTKM